MCYDQGKNCFAETADDGTQTAVYTHSKSPHCHNCKFADLAATVVNITASSAHTERKTLLF